MTTAALLNSLAANAGTLLSSPPPEVLNQLIRDVISDALHLATEGGLSWRTVLDEAVADYLNDLGQEGQEDLAEVMATIASFRPSPRREE